MILMEQLRSIKRELGLEKDDKSSLIENFRKKWEPKQDAAPEEVRRSVWGMGAQGGRGRGEQSILYVCVCIRLRATQVFL